MRSNVCHYILPKFGQTQYISISLMTDFGLEDFIIGLIQENGHKIKKGGLAGILDMHDDSECDPDENVQLFN